MTKRRSGLLIIAAALAILAAGTYLTATRTDPSPTRATGRRSAAPVAREAAAAGPVTGESAFRDATELPAGESPATRGAATGDAIPAGPGAVRIASYNMERLGQNKKDYTALAGVIGRFDVVAAIEVMNEGGMRAAMKKLGPAWSYAISGRSEGTKKYREYFGFFYDDRVELVRELGAYPGTGEFMRPPYGVRFRVKATGFTFNLVSCHIVYGDSDRERNIEINHLGKVYRHFEKLTGDTGTTIIAGDFNEEKMADFASIVDLGQADVIPVKGTTLGMRGPGHGYDHMFAGAALRGRITRADVLYWTTDFAGSRKTVSDHFPVYCVLETGRPSGGRPAAGH